MEWRKATASDPQNGCVEISIATDRVLFRDSKDKSGPQLRFTITVWQEFQDRLAA